jgi:hypothetical protein
MDDGNPSLTVLFSHSTTGQRDTDVGDLNNAAQWIEITAWSD